MRLIIKSVCSAIATLVKRLLTGGREKGRPMLTIICGRRHSQPIPLSLSVPIMPTGRSCTQLWRAISAEPGKARRS